MSTENGKDSPWKSNWRPAMGWLYLAVCICDFILFPIKFPASSQLINRSILSLFVSKQLVLSTLT